MQTNTAGMYGECSQCVDHTGFATAHVGRASQVYTTQAPGCSARALSQMGPAFHAFPRTKPLRFSGLCKGTDQDWLCVLCPFPGMSCSGDQVLGKHTAPGGPCVLITSPVLATQFPRFPGVPQEHRCAVCLFWGADLRLQHSWQMSTVQDPEKTWLATGNLLTVWGKMTSLEPRL